MSFKPFPKVVSWLSFLSTLFGAGGGLSGVIPPKYALLVTGVAGAVQSISHSLNGTGGKP